MLTDSQESQRFVGSGSRQTGLSLSLVSSLEMRLIITAQHGTAAECLHCAQGPQGSERKTFGLQATYSLPRASGCNGSLRRYGVDNIGYLKGLFKVGTANKTQ